LTKPKQDPFQRHRAALSPWRHGTETQELRAVLRPDIPGFAPFLIDNGLGPLWSEQLRTTDVALSATLPSDLRGALKQNHLDSGAVYLLQAHTLRRAARTLDEAGILYAVFKGAALRESLYEDPTLRPMDDLDILVANEQRYAALRVLLDLGMRLSVDPTNLSHEVALFDDQVHLDLHWKLFRPGRSRFELAPLLLEQRQRHGDLWLLSDSANLLVMLVHPAFAKHVCGPAAKLVRLVELDRLIRERRPDWPWVLGIVKRAGLCAAAWSTLHWLRAMLDTPVDDAVLRQLQPGRLHRAYLAFWIDHHLPSRLAAVPLAVQAAFTLALQDRPRDAARAALTLIQTVLRRSRESKALNHALDLE
jgi:hypothetical protein